MIISPKTKIGELLETYPELESVLIEISPVFKKLKNPILRKTVARVATIQQISVVGGINVDVIINRLRKEVGQSDVFVERTETGYLSPDPPLWFDEKKISIRFDATSIINSGNSPMNEILQYSRSLKPGEIMELRTPFVPAPILDILMEKQFVVYSIQKEKDVINYISFSK